MKIIPYDPAYFDKCISVFQSNMPKYFDELELPDFKDWLINGDTSNYFVLIENDIVIGCGGIFIDDIEKIGGFAWGMIHAERHRQGYGKRFGEFRISLLQSRCKHPIRLLTSQHTFEFYEKLGFEVKDIQKDGILPGLDKYTLYLKASD